jgi:uncharacterized protein YdcH (DUF465 family)
MSMDNHINKLRAEHQALDDEIDRMERTGRYDESAMHQLKKKKLALKDEIAKLTADADNKRAKS